MLGFLVFFAVPALLTASWFFYVVWPRQSVRLLRDELFVIRDELFGLGANPHVDLEFGDVAYGMLRSNLNGYIRYAEDINLMSMIRQIKIPVPEGVRPWQERWQRYLDECPEEVQHRLMELHADAVFAVIRHAVRVSFPGQLGMLIGWLKHHVERFRPTVESAGEAYAEEASLVRRERGILKPI